MSKWTAEQALQFFRSVIRSGEEWTTECREAYWQAMDELEAQRMLRERERAEPVAWRSNIKWDDGFGPSWSYEDNPAFAEKYPSHYEPLFVHPPQPQVSDEDWMRDLEERDNLRNLCGAVYQAAGAYDMPERFLDALSDAANGEVGERQNTDDLLPCRAPQVSVPDGWKLVPIEPTEEMLKAGATSDQVKMLRGCYDALLAAAPPAPAADCDAKDAERYRWLRNMDHREHVADLVLHRMNLDNAIDAAIAAKDEHEPV